jgi:UDP-N-acetylglucosamine 1-carboxyvinyltransferase
MRGQPVLGCLAAVSVIKYKARQKLDQDQGPVMDTIVIRGGQPLRGTIPISGAKNAALPLMAASLLTPDTLTLDNIPALVDITTLADVLSGLGVETEGTGTGTLALTSGQIDDTTAPYELVRKMRASVLVLGPLLARFGTAVVSLPGGCAIGTRPVDLHIRALEQMGAEIELKEGYIHAAAPQGLKGTEINFPVVTVGGTENILMAATLARGETVIENAAREPEVNALAECLVAMGADISGIGTECVVVRGVDELHGARFRNIPDRIEAGSYAVAAAATDGELVLEGADQAHLGTVVEALRSSGVQVDEVANGLRVRRNGGGLTGIDITTQPYPGFPTDMQAQMMVLMSIADGASRITEQIFENRFMHVPELTRMGADITVHGGAALVRGVDSLIGAPVMATDLRASMSLVLAGLVAHGETVVNRVYHLDRGYEHLEDKLSRCGADIRRAPEGE